MISDTGLLFGGTLYIRASQFSQRHIAMQLVTKTPKPIRKRAIISKFCNL